MTTRILITTATGQALTCLDGHHGARHAQAWIDDTLTILAGQGITDTLVVELHPAAGADDFRRDVLQTIGRLAIDLHTRPDGAYEIVGLARFQARGDGRRIGAATTGCALKLLQAPAHIHGARHALRISCDRNSPPTGEPRTATERRQLRRQLRAQQRAKP